MQLIHVLCMLLVQLIHSGVGTLELVVQRIHIFLLSLQLHRQAQHMPSFVMCHAGCSSFLMRQVLAV